MYLLGVKAGENSKIILGASVEQVRTMFKATGLKRKDCTFMAKRLLDNGLSKELSKSSIYRLTRG